MYKPIKKHFVLPFARFPSESACFSKKMAAKISISNTQKCLLQSLKLGNYLKFSSNIK